MNREMSSARDRLKDLEKQLNSKEGENAELINKLHKESKKLKKVFDKVEELREQIDGIKGNTERLKDALHNFYTSARKELHAEIQSLIDAFTKKSLRVTNLLKEFENELRNKKDTGSTEGRIHLLQCATLKKEFQDIAEENREIIDKYRNHMKQIYIKTVKITDQNIDDEEIERMLDEKQMFQIFIDNHLIETEVAKRQLDDLKARHNELLAVEQQIREVHSLFLQMALLVEEQQESLDRVEHHALNAREYVEQGATDIGLANKLTKKNRKLKIALIIVLIVFCLILLLIFTKL